VKPKLRVWLVFLDEVKIGSGRAEVLQAIEDLGSIKAAAEQFGMSYRHVCGCLRDLEKTAGFRFIERQRGGGTTGGHLTSEGKAFLARYWQSHQHLEAAAEREFKRIFR
jgi:molybdate transport system regulatory protein